MPTRFLAPTILLAAATATGAPASGPVSVEIRSQGESHALYRDGQPYFIKGVGGTNRLEDLAAAGGNSVRTWSAAQARPILDRAHELGLTVTVGLWVAHERHGFDYGDTAAVAAQLEKFRRTVNQLKDHPALLMWGIGNEVHLSYSDRRVWDAIDEIAAMIRRDDGRHPTMTVLAGANPEAVGQVMQRCPHIDVLGVNSYGGLPSLAGALRQLGWKKPYIVAEWGTNGFWEVGKTAWDAPLEPTSDKKATLIRQRHAQHIQGEAGSCLGSYAFLWGHKQERTPTWFGLFLESGEATAAVSALRRAWGGPPAQNRAPEAAVPTLAGNGDGRLQAGATYRAAAAVSDPDGDALTCRWELWHESTAVSEGGDAEDAPPTLAKRSLPAGEPFSFTAPAEPGAYRLYLYAFDAQGHAATANLPLFVEAGQSAR